MDLGNTLCEMVGAITPPDQDGKSLLNQITTGVEDKDRVVISEFIQNGSIPGRMIRKDKWKYISYVGYEDYDLLFNIGEDPNELNNLAKELPEKANELKKILHSDWNPKEILKEHNKRKKHFDILKKWGSSVDVEEPARWKVPEHARKLPIVK